MREMTKILANCIQKAESSGSRFRVALICPDEGLIEIAILARDKGLADPLVFSMKTMDGIETQIVKSPEEAVEKALELCVNGSVNTLVKGLVNTNVFLKSIVRSAFRTGYLTHCSILDIPGFEKPFVVSDGTVTPNPNLAQKIEILRNAVYCSKLIGISRPNVALLSANELILPGIPSGSDAAIISVMALRGQVADAVIDGPIALDSALSSEACEKKGLNFSFKPPADILIAPDLESAAMLIKSAVHLAGAMVAGILLGTKCPIVLTSRADSKEAKYLSLCICKLAAQIP